MAKSNLETLAFLWEKVKTDDLFGTFAACDQKIVIEFMKVCEY